MPFSLIRDTPADSYREKGTPGKQPKPPHHGVADDASRLAGGLAAADAPADCWAAARDDVRRPRRVVRVRRRRAGPLGARERAADAQPVRDRVGAAGHQLHRHEACLRRGLGRRHRQDRESRSPSLSPPLFARWLRCGSRRVARGCVTMLAPLIWCESMVVKVHLGTICGP